jgi:pyrimidine operon attenuation protein/uracil phosphoribosyltransferase
VTGARVPADDSGSGSTPQSTLLSAADVARVVDRMAHQIIESAAKSDFETVLLGIPTRGVPLARRLAERIAAFADLRLPVGSLDITLYRDDLRLRGVRPLGETVEPEGGIADRTVILVDDVLFSGRTIRAALDALTEFGRPRAVQLAVLVDRGHRQLPIRADYVGKNVPTSASQTVRVTLTETDGTDGVTLS